MLIHTSPGASVWPAAMIVWGPGYVSTAHRHHCVQLVMAMQGTLLVRRDSEDEWLECGAALIRPDAVHEVAAPSVPVLIAFIEVESELGAGLCERLERDIVSIAPARLARWRAMLGDAPTEARAKRWVQMELLRRRSAARIHPRVNRVLGYLRERMGTSEDFSLETLAEVAGLSQSRFMHAFTDSVGVPLRPYILWLRLQRASCELINGSTVTRAAHAAGFSDAAHLTRTFRKMLGTSPTELALRKRKSQGVTVEPPGIAPRSSTRPSGAEPMAPAATARVAAATKRAPK